jgi:hypothetical protein
MPSGIDPGQDRVSVVLAMHVEDTIDLLRFSASIEDFDCEELIRLAEELPRPRICMDGKRIVTHGCY